MLIYYKYCHLSFGRVARNGSRFGTKGNYDMVIIETGSMYLDLPASDTKNLLRKKDYM